MDEHPIWLAARFPFWKFTPLEIFPAIYKVIRTAENQERQHETLSKQMHVVAARKVDTRNFPLSRFTGANETADACVESCCLWKTFRVMWLSMEKVDKPHSSPVPLTGVRHADGETRTLQRESHPQTAALHYTWSVLVLIFQRTRGACW